MKKRTKKGRKHWKLYILASLVPLALIAVLLINLITLMSGGVAAVKNFIDEEEKQKQQQMQEVMQSVKLKTSPQIIGLKPSFKSALERAMEEADCLDLEEQEDAVIAWMMAVCAAYTDDWTVNTQRNIMGVPNFPKEGTPQESIEMSAELIVSLYMELTGLSGDGTFSVEEFKTEFSLDPALYYDLTRVKYAFDGGLSFSYKSSNDYIGGMGTDYSLQKMSLFTACYFIGDTSLAKWAALTLNKERLSSNNLYDGAVSGDSDVSERVYWNASLIDSYDELVANKVKEKTGGKYDPDKKDASIPEGFFDRAIFIGDSRIQGLEIYHGGILDGATFFAKSGSNSSGLRIADVEVNGKTEHLEPYLEAHDFDKVYIMCGINSMGYPTETNVRMFKEDLLDVVLEYQPNARIYILSDLGATEAKGTATPSSFSREKVNAYNDGLANLANGENIIYMDVASQFKDENGWLDTSVSDGGFHLTASANKKLAQYIADNSLGQIVEHAINYDLLVKVYSYYNAYSNAVVAKGTFGLPFDASYEYLVLQEPAVGDKFGFGRDAISDSNGNSSTGGATPHRGYDIPLAYGTPVYACCDGYISEIEFGSDETGFPTTAGRYLTIRSSDNAYAFDYFHLSGFAEGIHMGAEVKKGQLVGYSGNTSAGWSTWGSHFHFGVIDCSDYKYIDPLIILSNGLYFSTNIGGINDTALFEGRSDVKIITELPEWFVRSEYDEDTIRWLAAIIWGEAGNQPMEGKIAVGIVVMNRFEQWKDNYGYESVYDVITQGNGVQFNPAMPGHSFWTALESYDAGTLDQDCIDAAILAANGQKIIYYNGETYDFSNILYFANVGYKDRPGVINIGDHGFASYLYWRD